MNKQYRSDIDGLRAIAVMLVVLYHFGFSGITGGFVGVDVFFVISGFLITQILSKQISEGKFSFKEFYVRRIKRLMPAMLAMVSVAFVVFSFILAPNDYQMFSKSIIWVSMYLANIFYWKEYGGYFAGDTQEAPILHTWSLAVEEQFYLIWPLFLVFSYKFLGKNKTLWLSILGTIALVGFSEIATKMTIGAAYYLLPTRAYELMIGAGLALAWSRIPDGKANINHILSILGVTLIVYSGLTLTKFDSFPGINALYATLGTALLIYSGKGEQQGIVNKLISNKLFVFIGLISYSLYLWHWPMIVYFNYTNTELNFVGKIALVILAIGVAYLSYRFIETPFRHTKKSDKNIVIKAYLLPSVVLIGLSSLVVVNKGFPERFSFEVRMADKALNSHSNVIREQCHSSLSGAETKPVDDCQLGDLFSGKKGMLIGDSHANHYSGLVDVLAANEGLIVQDYTLDRCPPIIDLYWGKSAYKANKCKARNDISKAYIKEQKFDFVILGASWPNERSKMVYDNEKGEFLSGAEAVMELSTKIDETIKYYHDLGLKVVVLTDTPFIIDSKPTCPMKKAMFDKSMSCMIEDKRNLFLDNLLNSISSKYPNMNIIHPRDMICSNGKCQLDIGGVPLYRDQDHLNHVGSEMIGSQLLSHDIKLLGN